MAILSLKRTEVADLSTTGMKLISRGKVRDTYELANPAYLLPYATDALSIFDFVLNALIHQKGQVLTALTHFWFSKLRELGVRTHIVTAGIGIDSFLPQSLRNSPQIQSRSLVVHRLKIRPVEFIARGFLTGSAFKTYDTKEGLVYGHCVGAGLQDGDAFPYTLDTPTTKAEVGHDEPIDPEEIRRQYPEETYLLSKIYDSLFSFAYKQGIILADTKLEFGIDANGSVSLADEVGTPDSSRFWDKNQWYEAQKSDKRKSPPPFDKQLVRNWGIQMGINNLNPEKEGDNQAVHNLVVPESLINATAKTYRYILWRLTSKTVEAYWMDLGVKLPVPKKKVVIVTGSESDLPVVQHALHIKPGKHPDYWTQIDPSRLTVHVISCHRNPAELVNFVDSGCDGADVIICVGGKAFALPGVLDAWIHAKGLHIPVVGVAIGDPHSRSRLAAEHSIDELPGQPVITDEINNQTYTGPKGFGAALDRIDTGELPPPKPRQEKPAKFNVRL